MATDVSYELPAFIVSIKDAVSVCKTSSINIYQTHGCNIPDDSHLRARPMTVLKLTQGNKNLCIQTYAKTRELLLLLRTTQPPLDCPPSLQYRVRTTIERNEVTHHHLDVLNFDLLRSRILGQRLNLLLLRQTHLLTSFRIISRRQWKSALLVVCIHCIRISYFW